MKNLKFFFNVNALMALLFLLSIGIMSCGDDDDLTILDGPSIELSPAQISLKPGQDGSVTVSGTATAGVKSLTQDGAALSVSQGANNFEVSATIAVGQEESTGVKNIVFEVTDIQGLTAEVTLAVNVVNFIIPTLSFLEGTGTEADVFVDDDYVLRVVFDFDSDAENLHLIVNQTVFEQDETEISSEDLDPVDLTDADSPYLFQYKIPEGTESQLISLGFSLEDGLGNTSEEPIIFTFNVYPDQPFTLTEGTFGGGTTTGMIITGSLRGQGNEVTLDASTKYLLDGEILVADGAKLIIPAGTHLYGKLLTDPDYSGLEIRDGGKIEINGTAENPVYMTAESELTGDPQLGDWQGFRIRGEGLGTNSGIVRYLIVAYGATREGGNNWAVRFDDLGSETIVEYLQIYKSNDIGIRVRGGDVNLKYLFVYKAQSSDAGIRMDNEWVGFGQFWFLYAEDGNAADHITIRGQADPIISNWTVIGSGETGRGMRQRDAGTMGRIFNCIVAETSNSYRVEEAPGEPVDFTNNPVVAHSYGFKTGNTGWHSTTSPFLDEPTLNNGHSNGVLFGIDRTSYLPSEATPAPYDVKTNENSWFDTVDFIGAFKDADSDWTSDWTKFD